MTATQLRFTLNLRLIAAIAVLLSVFSTSVAFASVDATAATASSVVAAADDEGSKGGGKEASVIPTVNEGLITGIMTIIVFVAVLFVLGTQVWPKIENSLQAREDKIRDEIQAAELARQQARDALEEYERSLAQARAEAQDMLDKTRAQQAEMAAELRTKADTQLNEMREKAQRDIEAAKRAALNEIYSEASQLATLAAGKILQREIQPSDQQRLIEESLAELSAGRHN